MEPDLDDTRRAALRPSAPPRVPDIDDTVVRGHAAPPPELVEPPVPPRPRRPLEVEASAVEPRLLEGHAVEEHLVERPAVEQRLLDSPAKASTTMSSPEADASPGVEPLRAALPDGTQVIIDVPVYVGRRPRTPRVPTGVEPRLITIPSPARELSATHLELRTVGTTVVASDMRSTNGSVVQLPGAAPRTLIGGESLVVVAGTRIDLGDGAVIEILPALAAERS